MTVILDFLFVVEEISSEIYNIKESISKMKGVTLHGMTSAGDVVVDLQFSDATHEVLFYKLKESTLKLRDTLAMDDQATMTLMPTDDFVYSDTGHNSGLISWNLPTNVSAAICQTVSQTIQSQYFVTVLQCIGNDV